MSEWISVADKMPPPEKEVLAYYKNSLGNKRTIRAFFTPRWTVVSDGEAENYDEYSKEKDEYYWREGWYECIDNWGDFSAVCVTGCEITYWMPLPEPQAEKQGT